MAKSPKKPAKKTAKKPVVKKPAAKKPAKKKAAKVVVIESPADLKAFNALVKAENVVDAVLEAHGEPVERASDEVTAEEIAELLGTYGLDWKVEKHMSLTADSNEQTGHSYLQRVDTGAIFKTPVKDGYTIFQNSHLAEMLLRLCEKSGYELHAGGELAGGQKVYLQLNTNNSIKNLGENKTTVKGFLTALNSHGGGALGLGKSDVTVCCENTFAMAMQQVETRFSHYKNIHAEGNKLIKMIQEQEAGQAEQFAEYKQLAGMPITKEALHKVVLSVWGYDLELSEERNGEKISKQAIAKNVDLMESIKRETAYKGQTLWGLFSGVTHYTTHVLGKDEKRKESLFIGEGMKINNNAYIDILECAGIIDL